CERLVLTVFTSRTAHAPQPTLFPYTTLFRSGRPAIHVNEGEGWAGDVVFVGDAESGNDAFGQRCFSSPQVAGEKHQHGSLEALRSEEHTSELQSRENLVCRLLLEKKKDHDMK